MYALRYSILKHFTRNITCRVTTGMENLEMSGNLTAVRDFTKTQGSVREKILSGNSGLKLFIVSCIFSPILDLAELVHFILVSDHS